MPAACKQAATEFLVDMKVPRKWGSNSDFGRAFRSSDSNPDVIPALKSHCNLVMMASGVLSVIADWPRPHGAPSKAKVLAFVTALQQAHRAIITHPVTPQVRIYIEVNPCCVRSLRVARIFWDRWIAMDFRVAPALSVSVEVDGSIMVDI